MRTMIWWVRRDLRLEDNQALSVALMKTWVVPVFVQDPALLASRYVGGKAGGVPLRWPAVSSTRRPARLSASGLVDRQGEPG